MPQMKPLNWIMLFMFMNLILLTINMLNFYFLMIKKENKNLIYSKNNILNWKW